MLEIPNSKSQIPNRGAVSLATTLIIFTTALILALNVQFLGIGELLIGFGDSRSEQAFQAADSCVDEALLRLKRDNSYAGGSLSVGGGSCTITVSGAGATRTIDVLSTVGSASRGISVDVSLSGFVISIDDWDEDTN